MITLPIDVTAIKELNIKNLRPIDSNSVRGQSLTHEPLDVFIRLHEAGIETVVDLRQEGSSDSKYARKCEAAGLNYMNFKIKENMAPFNSRGNTKLTAEQFSQTMESFVKQLAQFFRIMDDGRAYVGCLLGLHRTDLAVSMNYLLNPNEPQSPPVLSHMFFKDEINFTNRRIGSIKNLLANLNPKAREILGLGGDIQEIFSFRAAKLRMMNMVK